MRVIGLCADGRVLGGDEAHALELLEQRATLEEAFALDIYAPVTFGLARRRGIGGGVRLQTTVGLGFVEVPPQRDPEHHGDLASGGADRLVVTAGWVDNVGDVEGVIAQGGGSEARKAGTLLIIASPASSTTLFIVGVRGFGVWTVCGEHDAPTRRHDGLAGVDIVGFEGEATEDGGDTEAQPVG